MSDQSDRQHLQFSATEGLLLIAGFMTVSVLFLVLVVVLEHLDNQIIALPTLSIAGIVLLLISLAAIAYVFVRTGLQDPKQALGLPAGSIQAVIALSLIVLFAILSVFIFTSMGPASHRKLTGLSKADRDAQIPALANTFAGWEKTGEDSYTVFVRDPGIDARNDVGKQLVVLIGTLMTSAVSFYFGTRATASGAEQAAQAVARGTARLSPARLKIEPATGIPRGTQQTIKIGGEGLSRVNTVAFRQSGASSGATFPATITARSDRELTCTVTPGADVPAGDYDVVLGIDDGTLVKPKGLKVLAGKAD